MKHLLDTRDLTRTQAIEILDVQDCSQPFL